MDAVDCWAPRQHFDGRRRQLLRQLPRDGPAQVLAPGERWPALRCGEVRIRTDAVQHVLEVEVQLEGLGPDAVRVELYADGIGGSGPTRQEMTRIQPVANANGPRRAMYRASVPATRLATDYTPRIIPSFAGVSVPLEADAILWQR